MQFLKRPYGQIEFVSGIYLLDEFSQKVDKIAALTNSSSDDINYQFKLLTAQFFWVKENDLDNFSMREAERLVQHIDPKDFTFVAVASILIHCFGPET